MIDTVTTVPCHLRTVRGADEPRVFARDGAVYANSEDVAAYFGKRHDHVLRDIRTLISNNNACAPNFGFTSRQSPMPSGGVRDVATCDMNRDGFTLLAMGFTGKRALGWKLKYIEAFNAMEAELAKPVRVPDDEPIVRQRQSPAIDSMDAGLDLLVTAETALHAQEWLDRDTVASIRGTIAQAIGHLRPAREFVNRDI